MVKFMIHVFNFLHSGKGCCAVHCLPISSYSNYVTNRHLAFVCSWTDSTLISYFAGQSTKLKHSVCIRVAEVFLPTRYFRKSGNFNLLK